MLHGYWDQVELTCSLRPAFCCSSDDYWIVEYPRVSFVSQIWISMLPLHSLNSEFHCFPLHMLMQSRARNRMRQVWHVGTKFRETLGITLAHPSPGPDSANRTSLSQGKRFALCTLWSYLFTCDGVLMLWLKLSFVLYPRLVRYLVCVCLRVWQVCVCVCVNLFSYTFCPLFIPFLVSPPQGRKSW